MKPPPGKRRRRKSGDGCELQRELEYFRQIVSKSRDPMTLVDKNYTYLAVNQAYCTYHKKKPEDIVGRSVAELLGEEAFQAGAKNFLDRCLGGEEVFYQDWFEFKGCGRRFMEVNYFPVTDENEEISGTAIFLHDITARKKLQDDQSAAMATTRALIDTPRDTFLLIEPDGTIVDCNAHAAAVLSSSASPLPGKILWDFFPAEIVTSRKKHLETVLKTGKPHQHPDIRGNRLLDVTLHPILDEHNRVQQIVIMTRDVTEIKQLESELKQRAQELSEVNKALETLLDQSTRTIIEQENRMYDNLQQLVFPYLLKLEQKLEGREELLHVNVIKANLEKITSSFALTVSSRLGSLTPREMQVAQLIKQGKLTKDIALLLHISPRTVEFYRDKLRKKLGLKNKLANLRSHLSSLT